MKFVTVILISLAIFSQPAIGRAPDESEFLAAGIVAEDISNWVMGLENVPRSVGIFSVYANHPFEQDYATIVETELLKQLSKRGLEKVTTCSECRAPQVSVQDDRLVVRKGTPDIEALKKLGAREPVDSFLTLEIYRTKLSIIVQTVLYANPSGAVIAAERFRVSAINMMDTSVQILLEVGGGKPMGGSTTGGTPTFITAANLLLLEEVGFAKAGLNLGVLTGGANTIIYMNPTLAFYGRFGRSSLGYALNLGVGFGIAGPDKGIALRGAYEIFMGSLAVIGPEVSYFLPQTGTTGQSQGFFGLHIGIALGR